MHRLDAALAAFLLAILLAGCGGGGGDSGSPPTLPSTPSGRTIAQSITSEQTGTLYNLSIYLPPGYDSGSTRYPIIYLTDAEYRFVPDLLVLQQSGVDAILVGIGNMGDARRQVDFLMPGARPYYAFLTQELMPYVEGQFRVDTGKRIYSGHSSGGLFGAYAFMLDQVGIRHYAAFMVEDPSLWQQPLEVDALEQQMFDLHAPLPVTVFISGAANGNFAYAQAYCNQLAERHYASLDLQAYSYIQQHLPSDPYTFGDALNHIFATGIADSGSPMTCV